MARDNVSPVQSFKVPVNASDGTASDTNSFVGPCVRFPIAFTVALANIADGDLVTDYPIGTLCGGSGKVVGFTATPTTVASTGGKASTLNLEIGSTNVTGGVLALTTTTMGTIGVVQSATAITAANTFTATSTLSIEASSTTTFSQGIAVFHVWVELDNADNNFATLSSLVGATS